MSRPLQLKALGYAALIAAGAGLLAACGHSAPTRFFTLTPAPPPAGAPSAYAGPPLKVLSVTIPPALDREELISEEAGGEVRVHDFEHWEAPLGQTARQALVQDLAARFPAGAVLGPATPGSMQGVANVTLDVVAFHIGAQDAVMQAGWTVSLPPGAGSPAATWSAPLTEARTAVTGADGSATAQAFSQLLAQVSDRIAAELPARVDRLLYDRALAAAQARASKTPTAVTTRVTTRSHTVDVRRTASPSRP